MILLAFLLSGCSFSDIDEELNDLSSIYKSKKDPAFTALDSGVRATFGEDYFGASSNDLKIEMDLKGGNDIRTIDGRVFATPKEVSFKSSGLQGEAKDVKSEYSVKETNLSLKEGNVTVDLSNEPLSFGLYTSGEDLYYDFSDLKELDFVGDAIPSSLLKRRIKGVGDEGVISLGALLPFYLEEQANELSEIVETLSKDHPDKITITNQAGEYTLSYSNDGLDDLKDYILIYNEALFATPMVIPLSEDDDGLSLTITKEEADSYVEKIFADITLNRYDCSLLYSEEGIKAFYIDLDVSFAEDAFPIGDEESEFHLDIERFILKGNFRLLTEEESKPVFPERFGKMV